jgi:putative endonuclease
MSAYVYILKCSDGSYYLGSTRTALETRVGEHNAGKHEGYTYTRRPVVLLWAEEFQQITDAIAFERRLKGWSRAKNGALIAGRFDLLPALARGRSGPAKA